MKPAILNSKITKLINDRLVDEYTAFYAYQAMSNWAKGNGYEKAGKFFQGESDDELVHARKLQQYLVDWNVTPDLPAITKPKTEFKSLIDAIETAYGLELDLLEKYQETTADVMAMDTAVYEFLSQFLAIQTESVTGYSDMLNLCDGAKTDDKFQTLLIEDKLFELNT